MQLRDFGNTGLRVSGLGAVQTSISVCDQVNLGQRLPKAIAASIAVIAKRPLAGAVWRHAQRPDDHADGPYRDRWVAMGLADQLAPEDINAMALRFTGFLHAASSAIVGTSKLAHFKQNLAALALGPLVPELQDRMRQAFLTQDSSGFWGGLI